MARVKIDLPEKFSFSCFLPVRITDINYGGVTRDSVITLLEDSGIKVVEKKISIDEIIQSYKSGSLREVFGTGTAATISLIKELKYRDNILIFNISDWTISPNIKKTLNNIRTGKVPDTHTWLVKV